VLRKLLTNFLILVVAAIPLGITVVNFKLNYPTGDLSPEQQFNVSRMLINDVASQITFLSITVCILALSDYWDFRSDSPSRQLEYWHSLPHLRILQTVSVFLLSFLIVVNFTLYYAEMLSVTIVDFRKLKLVDRETFDVEMTRLLSLFRPTALKFFYYSLLLLISSTALYIVYFFVQTEQRLVVRLLAGFRK